MGKIGFYENGLAYYQESETSEKVTLEGYLSSENEYNRVLFLLRESNSNGEMPTKFWFKDVCTEEGAENYFLGKSDTRTEKRIASQFRNRFSGMLKHIGKVKMLPTEEAKKELCKSAFLNLNPYGGESAIGEKFKETLADFEKGEGKRWKAIEALNPEYIFTCSDIFNAIAKAKNIKTVTKDGLNYMVKDEIKPKRKFAFTLNNQDCQNCIVMEIYHPSYPLKTKAAEEDVPK